MSSLDRAMWFKKPSLGPGPDARYPGWHPINDPYVNTGGSAAYSTQVPTISVNGSIDFNGGYITAPAKSFMLGTGDFCIETWYWLKNTPGVGQTLFSNLDSYIQAENFFEIALNRSGNLQKYSIVTGNGGVLHSYSNITYESWVHLAVVRYNGVITIYVNGLAETQTLTNTNDLSGDSTLRWGQSQANLNGSQFYGYLSNFRVVVGSPVYTDNFSLLTLPLKTVQPNTPNVMGLDGHETQLLLNVNSRNGWLYDSSAYHRTLTPHGMVEFTYNQKPASTEIMALANGSMSFNGSTAYMAVDGHADLGFSQAVQDFTIEFYFNPLDYQENACVLDYSDNALPYWAGWRIRWDGIAAKLVFEARDGSHGRVEVKTSVTFNMNTWKHVALVRRAGTITWFINGIEDTNTTNNTAYAMIPAAGTKLYIGVSKDVDITVNGVKGANAARTQMYMTGLRIVKALAVYTGTFTLPRLVMSTVQPADVNIAALTGTETSLLLSVYSKPKFREDSSARPKTIRNYGGIYTSIRQGYYHKAGKWEKFFPNSGLIGFDTAGTYTFRVPPGVHSLIVDIGGAGGGGGGAEEVGVGSAGGGGGGGGYYLNKVFPVVPMEYLTIQVGAGGAGAPYVGRTTNAPAGGGGGTTTLIGQLGTLTATGGGGGAGGASGESGGGGGGGKIICTKLYELGLMDKEIYEADQAFGAQLVQVRPDIYNGYRAWAEIVVDWMEGKGPKMMPWMSDKEFSEAAKRWSITWAKDIATPWAEEMAYKMGKKSEGSLTGRMITAAGIPICKAVGMWQRIVGPSKKPAGFIKGLALIAIFIMFKTVAELGRAIEKKKDQAYA